MLKRVLGAACLCAMAVAAQSSDLAGNLTGEQIKAVLAGATLEIDTPLGTKLPVHCGQDGRLSGRAGSLAWYLGWSTDRGRWWIAGDQVCIKWNRWLGSEPQCLRLRKEGRLIRWRNQDGSSGTATITVPPQNLRIATVMPPLLPGAGKVSGLPETPPAAPKPPTPLDAKPPPGEAVTDGEPEAAARPAGETETGSAAEKDAGPPAPPKLAEPPKLAAPPPKLAAPPRLAEPPPKQAEPRRQPVPLFKVANVRSGDVLNVRSGPSADFDIVGGLPPGSRGIAITSACRAQWCPVKHRATSGWVNSTFLAPEALPPGSAVLRDAPGAPRSCLTPAARRLLERIEKEFGPVQVISTCRAGATMPGTWRLSRHARGNAIDFNAGSRKDAIIAWLIANHRRGGTMTYAGRDHIHVDIGPYFVSIAGGPRWTSWRSGRPDAPALQ